MHVSTGHVSTGHESTDPETGSAAGAPTPPSGKPWRTALAGLLLLGTAGGMMAYGAPSRAAVPPHSQPAHSQPAHSQPAHSQAAQEGTLVSATLLRQVSAKSVRAELAGARLAPGAPALGGGEVRYGVDAYRVAYRTVDANGR